MKASLYITKEYATICIQHYLQYHDNPTDKKINSYRRFLAAVRNYLSMYGSVCIEDHESEYRFRKNDAENIVNKFYKP